jgi:hypothetical protein
MVTGLSRRVTKEAQDLKALLLVSLQKLWLIHWPWFGSSKYCAMLKVNRQSGSKLSLRCWVNGPTDLIQFDALNFNTGRVPEFTLVHIIKQDGCFNRSCLGCMCMGNTPSIEKIHRNKITTKACLAYALVKNVTGKPEDIIFR